MSIFAAGVLVIRQTDGKLLCFRRAGDENLSIPCGKVEPDENVEVAAVRECMEETGYLVKVTSAPFVDVDPISGKKVAVFCARIIDYFKPPSADEGVPIWGTAQDLRNGTFGEYNSKMLDHFGVK